MAFSRLEKMGVRGLFALKDPATLRAGSFGCGRFTITLTGHSFTAIWTIAMLRTANFSMFVFHFRNSFGRGFHRPACPSNPG